MSAIIEYVEFKANVNASDSEVIAALKQTDALLNEISGFEYRVLAKRDDVFVEVVYWKNQDSADAGLKTFSEDERSNLLFSLIDKETVQISYSEIL
ncbi:hypothetical protein JQC92_20770 [Shewanella sp. 202IG2-18]|uniref:hypothetical protein n=1 Tax=Parashewanella hymeniacidonis TaxID=2807618 RepID=UPI0019616AF3|nr:hypothetical protein [Parashewanella hymeniacidonis]MBM7074425.1 hypothetical protein [Parashewanella hymeniacidonis]